MVSFLHDYDTQQAHMKTFEDTYEWNRNYTKEYFKINHARHCNIRPESEIRCICHKTGEIKYTFNTQALLDEIKKEDPDFFL